MFESDNEILDIEILAPTIDEKEHLEQLSDSYLQVSEMSQSERLFINSLILRHRPKKLLEIGVYAGAASVVILNAIKDIEGAVLNSIDKLPYCYRMEDKNCGFLVDDYPDLKKKWQLHTGGFALDFIEEIGGGIDFCLIDTVHINPGEILDFLMVLPFLSDDATVVFHDTNLHAAQYPFAFLREIPTKKSPEACAWSITNNLLMSSIHGRKIVQENFSTVNKDGNVSFGNIAGIQLSSETKKHVFEIFNLLTIRWHYNITPDEREDIIRFFSKHYHPFYIDYIRAVFQYHDICFSWEENNLHDQNDLLRKLAESQQEIDRIKNSSSWKVTAPIRSLKRKLKSR